MDIEECRNCINGLVPSPEAIEAAGAAMWDGSVHGWSDDDEVMQLMRDVWRRKAERGLLAAAGDLPGDMT